MTKIESKVLRICGGKCKLKYRECLTHLQRQDLKENGRLMANCLKRNLAGLFSPMSSDRLPIRQFGLMGGQFPSQGF